MQGGGGGGGGGGGLGRLVFRTRPHEVIIGSRASAKKKKQLWAGTTAAWTSGMSAHSGLLSPWRS